MNKILSGFKNLTGLKRIKNKTKLKNGKGLH